MTQTTSLHCCIVRCRPVIPNVEFYLTIDLLRANFFAFHLNKMSSNCILHLLIQNIISPHLYFILFYNNLNDRSITELPLKLFHICVFQFSFICFKTLLASFLNNFSVIFSRYFNCLFVLSFFLSRIRVLWLVSTSKVGLLGFLHKSQEVTFSITRITLRHKGGARSKKKKRLGNTDTGCGQCGESSRPRGRVRKNLPRGGQFVWQARTMVSGLFTRF